MKDHKIQHRTASQLASEKETLRFSDGSVESDLPMQQLSELFNVNHFIVSQVDVKRELSVCLNCFEQVNPHSFLFSSLSMRAHGSMVSGLGPFFGLLAACLHFLKAQTREW